MFYIYFFEKIVLVKLKSSLRKLYGGHHDLVDRYGISVSQMTSDMFQLSKLSRRVPLVEQELLSLPKHLSSPPFYVHCLSFFLCPLCCLSLFNLWVLITPLVLSNVSYNGNAKQLIS
jgi:hypothetical protein